MAASNITLPVLEGAKVVQRPSEDLEPRFAEVGIGTTTRISETSGDLDFHSGDFVNVGNVNGRDLAADSTVLDNLNSTAVKSGDSAGGDLTGTYPNPTIAANAVTTAKINALAVTDAKIAGVAYSKVTGAPSSLPPDGSAGGDLTGTYPNPTIAALAVTDAKINDVAYSKVTGAPSSLPPSGSAGGDLTSTYPNPQLATDAVTTTKIAALAVTDAKIAGVAYSKVTGAPSSLPPNGSAGGDLTGTYPNPTIAANAVTTAKINALAVTDAKINDVAYSKVTGAPSSLPPDGSAGGDLTGTYPNPTIAANAVTTAKINNGAVDETKIASSTFLEGIAGGSGTKIRTDYSKTFLNSTGSTIAIRTMVLVQADGSIAPAQATQTLIETKALGITDASIADAASGLVTVKPGAPITFPASTFTPGLQVYLSNVTLGGYTQSVAGFTTEPKIVLGKAISDSVLIWGPQHLPSGGAGAPTAGGVYSDGTAFQSVAFAGNANKVFGVNNAASAMEAKSIAVGTSGTDFAVAHSAGAITLNLPDAGSSARGAVTSTTQTFGGIKNFSAELRISDGSSGSPGVAFTNDPNTGMYRIGNDNLGFANGGVKSAEVNADGEWTFGKLGGPGLVHTFQSQDRTVLSISSRSSNSSQIRFNTNNVPTAYLTVSSSGVLTFAGAASDAFFNVGATGICSFGNPNVPTDGPHDFLNKSTATHTAQFRNVDTTTGSNFRPCLRLQKGSTNNTVNQVFQEFYIDGGATGSGQINANGASQAAFGSLSDARLKTNIQDLPSQLGNVLALRPVEFDYIAGGHQLGFIAQEMMHVYPDVVAEDADTKMLKISGWDKTTARLVKAIQELDEKNKSLEKMLAALEIRLKTLES